YGSGGSGGKGVDGRRNNGGGFSGSDFFGGGGNSGAIVDPYRPPAMVMECSRGSRNQLVCQDVDMIRAKQRIQVRAQKLNRAKVAQPKQQPQRQMPKPRLKQAMKPKRKVFPRFAAYVSK
ncbi:MAG: hypothetical protein ACXWQJ_19030, partial [Bdellovibrionota bacterium]